MDGLSKSINLLQKRLETVGSKFSYDEIHEILKVMKDVQLKLIVANVPPQVFSSETAREAFELLFKSFDANSKFVYLPSFKRVQIYMTTPEATLCARLQTQGWKLPNSILNEQTNLPEETTPNYDDGITCFIDQVDCPIQIGSSDDEENDDNSVDDSEGQKHCIRCLSLTGVDFENDTDSAPGGQVITVKEVVGEGALADNTNDLSGDDTMCPSQPPLPLFTPHGLAREGESDAPAPLCRKHRRLERRTVARQHLAPPKPARLFLLSPPCSPPVGWQPKPECEPVINYDLLEALASLSPGEQFELHPRNEQNSHPSIVITPCEHAVTSNEEKQSRLRIVQTRCPDRSSQ